MIVNMSTICDAHLCLCESVMNVEYDRLIVCIYKWNHTHITGLVLKSSNKIKVSGWYYSSMLINAHIMAYRYLSIINTMRCVNTEQQGVGELCDTSLKTMATHFVSLNNVLITYSLTAIK